MTDERPPEQEALWQELRAIEPPVGAKQRVREALDRRLARRRHRFALAVVPIAGAAVALAIVVSRDTGDDVARPRVLAVSGASQDERALAEGDRLGSGVVRVDDRLRVALGGSEIEVVGPAAVELSPRGVVLREGKLEVFGDVDVGGPECTARVRGRSDVALQETKLIVTVFAGSAEIAAPVISCEVIDLTDPKTATREPDPPPPVVTAPTRVAEVAEPVAPAEAAAPTAPASPTRTTPPARPPSAPSPATPSALKQQSDAYWAAQRIRGDDPEAALALLHDFARRWPRSELSHEVGLSVIDILVQLGRTDDARAAARRFLRRFPTSARADHVRTIAGEAP